MNSLDSGVALVIYLLPAIWSLEVIQMAKNPKLGIRLSDLTNLAELSLITIFITAQYFYYLQIKDPLAGALLYTLITTFIFNISGHKPDEGLIKYIRSFTLEYGLLSSPSAVHASAGVAVWILSAATGAWFCERYLLGRL